MELFAVKDRQTVTKEGTSLAPRIEGVLLRRLISHEDDRGAIMEMYRPSWGFHPDPLVYVYQAWVRPKKVKGWIVHKEQDDRIVNCVGTIRIVLFDAREDSSTYQMINQFVLSEKSPSLILFPKGVFHAVENIGQSDALFINMPTKPYNHENPDKFRLPLKNDLIPFEFGDATGG